MKALYVIGLYLVTLAICFALSLLIWGGITWVAVWALTSMGVTTIGSWTVAFSWKLVILIALVFSLLRTRVNVKTN